MKGGLTAATEDLRVPGAPRNASPHRDLPREVDDRESWPRLRQPLGQAEPIGEPSTAVLRARISGIVGRSRAAQFEACQPRAMPMDAGTGRRIGNGARVRKELGGSRTRECGIDGSKGR